MRMFYCLISNKEATDDPTNIGWTYCKKHESEWIPGNDETERYNTIGFVKGCDFIEYKGKVYELRKVYQDLDDKRTVILCVESIMACDR